MDTKFNAAMAKLQHAINQMGAALSPKPTTPKVDTAPIIGAIAEHLPGKTVLPVQPVHAALAERLQNGGKK